MSTVFEYYLVAAFSNQPFGGNPAIVAFLDPNETKEDVLIKLAATFNQPMTVYLSKENSTHTTTSERFSVRYFTPTGTEAMLCIHATLAAAKVIFQTERVGKEVKSLEFVTRSHGVVTASKVTSENGNWIELDLVKGDTVEVLEPEKKRITEIVNGVFGKSLAVNFVGKGVGRYNYCLLIEVEEKDDITNLSPVNNTRWAETGYIINAITARSSTGNKHFTSRVFLSFGGGVEDPVCGSAHAVLGPYWAEKQALDDGQEIRAAQVSSRGGDLRLFWVNGAPNFKMRGEATMNATGTFVF